MGCMKCGQDIPEDQVFCDFCLEVMAKYPVKPETAVQLPRVKEVSITKKTHVKRRQPPTLEEQITTLKRRLRGWILVWLITLLLLLAALYPAVMYFYGDNLRLPGQNYSTFSEVTEP